VLELQIWLHPQFWKLLPKFNTGNGVTSLDWLLFSVSWMWPSDI
jgi:hypothetical protein